MAQANNTKSTLSWDKNNKTSTSLSTNIIIAIEGGDAIGAIQTLSVTEAKGVRMIDEIGTDGHIDSAPNKSTDITGNCHRVRFDGMRIAEAFGRGFVHVGSQAYPFDIVITDQSRRDPSSYIKTIIKNVWITQISVTYGVADWVITDELNYSAETIYSYRGNNTNVVGGGTRSVGHLSLTQETWPDRGFQGRRGSLDIAGLLDLGDIGTYF